VILVNGRPDHVVDALDRGLGYGDGVFRTMRAQQGRVRLWRLHFAKLQRDCERLGIACPDEADLRWDVERVLADHADCVVKAVVTRGCGGRGYAGFDAASPTRIVARFPFPAARPDSDEHGVCTRWCRIRLGHQPALAGVKHLNRLENVLARREWTCDAIAEGILCDVNEQVIGGTMSNVFVLEQGRLVTPPLDRCGVEGVQRARLLAMAPAWGLGCSIEPLTRARLLAAEQVYLTNSVMGLWWISRLDDRCWSRAPLTALLQTTLHADDE
jgi:4-amino-4-deoxychorismate lyase